MSAKRFQKLWAHMVRQEIRCIVRIERSRSYCSKAVNNDGICAVVQNLGCREQNYGKWKKYVEVIKEVNIPIQDRRGHE